MKVDWPVVPIWSIATEIRRVIDPSEFACDFFHYSIPVVEETGTGRVEAAAEVGSAKLLVHGGEILISKLNPRKGRVLITKRHELPLVTSPEFIALRPGNAVVDRFLAYMLSSETTRLHLDANVQSVTRSHQRVTPELVRHLRIALPSLDEQRRISNFLDAETTRIKRLDELASGVADLLAERRRVLLEQALVNSAVPTQKLFRCLQLLRDGTHQPPARTSVGVPLLTARNVSSGTLQLTDQDTFVSPEDAEVLEASLRPQYRDVLLSVKGTVGASAIVPSGFPRAVLDRNLALLRPQATSLLNEWLVWVLRTRNLQDQMKLSVAAAAQPGLPLGVIRELRIPDVEIEKQKEQVNRIEQIDGQLSDLESKIRLQRGLLAERRQTLITAAVTGGISI